VCFAPRGDPFDMPTIKLFLRIMPLLLAMASLLAYGSATPASAGIARGSLARESSLGHAGSSSVDPCLVGRWVSTKIGSPVGGSGLAKMQLAILANGHATLNLTGSTPFVVPSLEVSNSFVGTEVFRIASSHTASGDGFSIFPSNQHITETIVFGGQKLPTKAFTEGFFDAANYSCGSTKLRTDFNLSQGGVYLHGFVATFKRR
jgi:hypothetical protein